MTDELVTFTSKVRKIGDSFGVIIPSDIIKTNQIELKDKIELTLNPISQEDENTKLFRLINKQLTLTERDREQRKQLRQFKKLYDKWYEQRVCNVDFLSNTTGEHEVVIEDKDFWGDADAPFFTSKTVRIRLEKNQTINLLKEVANLLELEGFGTIIREPIPPSRQQSDFLQWMEQKDTFESFKRTHPELKSSWKKLVITKGANAPLFNDYAMEQYKDNQ